MIEPKIISGSSPADVVSFVEGSVFVLYDAAVASGAGEIIAAIPDVKGCIGIDVSEQAKCMDTVLMICRSMLEAGVGRGDTLICVGGGITSDIGGFAASIYKRGIPYINVPTTLLSQVDAGIGGKNGVNFDGYKNMLGTIVQPLFTFVCPAFLQTLPRREFLCGMAEMLKTFLLVDEGMYSEAVGLFPDERPSRTKTFSPEKRSKKFCPTPVEFSSGEMDKFVGLVLKAAEIKAAVVRVDPYEKGRRAILNLGHTFAHAIESLAATKGDDIAHGEAVSMGIVLAARLGDRLGGIDTGAGLEARIRGDFERIGLPVDCPYGLDEMAPAMAKDKKGARFVLLEAIGKPYIKEISVTEAITLLHTI